jgi:pilus assembly protein CpaC
MQGGEVKLKRHIGGGVAAECRRRAGRTTQAEREAGEGRYGRRFLAMLAAAIVSAGSASLLPPGAVGEASAQRQLNIAAAKRTVTLMVAVGKTEDVRIDAPFTEVTVGDAEVADVTPLTDRTLSILGRKIGTTRVSVYGEGKRPVGIFDVEVTYDVSRLATEISRATSSQIKVSSVNGRIMLSGSSPDATTLDKAVVIARQFAPDIINTVQVRQPQQVMLEVRFVEATRKAGRELGVQWAGGGRDGIINIGQRRPAHELPVTGRGPNILAEDLTIAAAKTAAGVLSGSAPFGFLIGTLSRGGVSVDVAINALEQQGLARSLAEPNLVALSGDTASFLAGGEYPVPVPGALGTITIDYKRYGVGLAFTPTVLKDGLINLKIEPEVSELDFSRQVQVAGVAVPPLIVRRASTTVELRDGQSFVIGGLLLNVGRTAQEQLPWLGDVPVLGALFRSAQYQKEETDLAIIVTPRIVRPLAPGNPIRTPLDGTLPANDHDLFLMGKPEVAAAAVRAGAHADRPFTGHMLDLPKRSPAYVSARN